MANKTDAEWDDGWTVCPHCNEQTRWESQDYCMNGCYGITCTMCDEIPDPPDRTIEVKVGKGSYHDLCQECLTHEPKATVTSSMLEDDEYVKAILDSRGNCPDCGRKYTWQDPVINVYLCGHCKQYFQKKETT